MTRRLRAFRGAFLFLCSLAGLFAAVPAQAQYWQCVTFARAVSGIELFGNAYSWWEQAEGRYARGQAPQVGAVMVMKPGNGMRVGHVAMVSSLVDARTVKLTHANWSVRGGVERDVTAVDVSAAGDWSQVRVWWGPIGDLGQTRYATYGFIYPNAPAENAPVTARADTANTPA